MGNKRRDRYTQQDQLEDSNVYLKTENHFLKKKNEDLAKALADSKIRCQKLEQDGIAIHERLYFTDLEKFKYRESLNIMGSELQTHIEQCLNLTEQMSNTLARVKTVLHANAITHLITSPKSQLKSFTPRNGNGKTKVVKPMVSGHTISSPKINLPRVTATQLAEMMNHLNEENSDANNVGTNEMEFEENNLSDNGEEEDAESNNEEEGDAEEEDDISSSENSNEAQNKRLETMMEEDEDNEDDDEEEEEETITSSSVVTGVFRDLKVYISPLSSKHFIKLESKSLPLKKRSVPASICKKRGKSQNSKKYSRSSSTTTVEGNDTSTVQNDNVDASNRNHDWSKESSLASSTPNRSNGEEPDPLEGPSHLWNSLEDSNSTTNPIPNQTSTPISTVATRAKSKRKHDLSKTPTRSSHFVTKRRSFSSRNLSSIMHNCTVHLQQMSPNCLKSYTSNNSPTLAERSKSMRKSDGKRDDSSEAPNKSRTSIQSSNKKRRKNTKTSISSISPKKRVRRAAAAVTYKEPSLNTKMRRN